MTFIKQHKKHLETLTKKQLIQQVLNHIDITANIENQFNDSYDELYSRTIELDRELNSTKLYLTSAESAIRMYENFNPWQFYRHKYFK